MRRLKGFLARGFTQIQPARGLKALMFLMAGLGMVILFTASWHFSRTVFKDPYYLWRRQLILVILGALAVLGIARLPLERIKAAVPFLVWSILILNLLTYIPGIGYTSGGARRWIEVAGVSFQPSELARVALVLYLARMLEKNAHRLDDTRNALLPPFLVAAALILSVYGQNDFSTAAYLSVLSFGMFFASGVSWGILAVLGFLGTLGAGLMLSAQPYRMERFQSWFSPLEDPAGAGYQVLQAWTALERGGVWGQGLGQGEMKLGGIPAAHSDFVMAVAGEEMGFMGIAAILFLFSFWVCKVWLAASRVEDLFSQYACYGLGAAVYWQVLLNLGVVSGLVPATGIPLPLFSAGGSAAFTTVIIFGFIVKFLQEKPPKETR